MKAACLWSGGKDSCFACWRARAEGNEVCRLVNFLSGDGRDAFHGVRQELMCLQSEALGIPIIQRETTPETYETVYRGVMEELRAMGIEGLVTGDMDVVEHREWVDSHCREVGLEALMPLWGQSPEALLSDFVEAGFEAVVVCVKKDFFDETWLGRRLDEQLVADLHAIGVTPGFHVCGENGEYHTLVVDGPCFAKRIHVARGEKVWRDGYGFFDIGRARLVDKVV